MSLTLDATLYAPFGAYSKDLTWYALQRDLPPLSLAAGCQVYRCTPNDVVVKQYELPVDLERSWRMMHLAGDCCVSIVGRVFADAKSLPLGFCMPIESCIDPASISTKERIRIIHQLNGDIKPHNLLLCSDGRLRLCDFDGASVEDDGYTTSAETYPYCSSFRARNVDPVPMTRAEDVCAMGLSMWEIYTGRTPLTYNSESLEDVGDILENRVHAGFLPDMQLIDDAEIFALIQTCLDAAPECPDATVVDAVYCLETRFTFGYCKVQPPHLYSRIVHGWNCGQRLPVGEKDGPCENPFIQPKIVTSRLDPCCPKCIRSVTYVGLAG